MDNSLIEIYLTLPTSVTVTLALVCFKRRMRYCIDQARLDSYHGSKDDARGALNARDGNYMHI